MRLNNSLEAELIVPEVLYEPCEEESQFRGQPSTSFRREYPEMKKKQCYSECPESIRIYNSYKQDATAKANLKLEKRISKGPKTAVDNEDLQAVMKLDNNEAQFQAYEYQQFIHQLKWYIVQPLFESNREAEPEGKESTKVLVRETKSVATQTSSGDVIIFTRHHHQSGSLRNRVLRWLQKVEREGLDDLRIDEAKMWRRVVLAADQFERSINYLPRKRRVFGVQEKTVLESKMKECTAQGRGMPSFKERKNIAQLFGCKPDKIRRWFAYRQKKVMKENL